MLRRSHKKTRRGAKCDECRRRHIRCDQRRPVCINCSQADRTCSYRDAPPAVGAGSPDSVGSLRMGDSRSPSSAASTSNPPTPNSQDRSGSEAPDAAPQPPSAAGGGIINMTHLELFQHFSNIIPPLFAGEDPDMLSKYIKVYREAAFMGPYLMHEALAFAARHLSITKPDSQAQQFYLNQATVLQTTALSLFRASIQQNQGPETSLPSFLFSSLLGTHILSDTVEMPVLHLDEFLGHFFDWIKVYRGVRPIYDQYKADLLNSELRPFLAWGWSFITAKLMGSECAMNREMIAKGDLSPDEAEACTRANDMLQAVIDGCRARPSFPGPAPWVTIWLSIISPAYTELLLARRPEALVIFAHYGAMIHLYYRDVWLVGESGKHVVHMVSKSLGPSWASWLHWPIEVVDQSVPTTSEQG